VAAVAIALAGAACAAPVRDAGGPEPAAIPPRREATHRVRVATFNASLSRRSAGALVEALATADDRDARAVARIIRHVRPDVLLLNEFDSDGTTRGLDLFRANYLAGADEGLEPIEYPHAFVAPSNTGVASGFDLDRDARRDGPGDALGFGRFPGQYGMAVLSRHPIRIDDVRTFRGFLWRDMPGASLPDDPATPEPADWYEPAALDVLPLPSKSHWDVPVVVGDDVIHLLVSHPTPPVFDGDEDRNGHRNHDEIRFWIDYVTLGADAYMRDDRGIRGGLEGSADFVIMGDLNADPHDGETFENPARAMLDASRINAALTPRSAGGREAARAQGGRNLEHRGDPAADTADFRDTPGPGNLRADYVLPSRGLPLAAAGVFWPEAGDPLARLVRASDHRLVWIALVVGARVLSCGSAPRDVTATTTVLSARGAAPGPVWFEWGVDSTFIDAERIRADPNRSTRSATVRLDGLLPDTCYVFRVTDDAGSIGVGSFRTLPVADDE
jgi:endonuclease/exonuclease/phosphatase family metal-dependent hydrolase